MTTVETLEATGVVGLSRAIAQIVSAETVDDAINAIRMTARALIGCDGIAVIRKKGEACHYVEEDAIGPLWKGQNFPMSACISGWSMINRQTAVVPDIKSDERIPQELYANTFVRALAMAPVKVADPIGAIGAYWSKPYSPTRDEVAMLEAIANAAASAIEKAGLVAALNDSPRLSAVRASLHDGFQGDIARIEAIAAVPTILDVALRLTGMGFAAVARVTESRWITCQSLDHVKFGLKPGDELPVASTICNEIRDHREPVVIDDVSEDDTYRDHHTPKIYGLRSYISVPIILADGTFFGTLCAIDPKPAKVKDPVVIGTFKLFAELIAQHLDTEKRLEAVQDALAREHELTDLREQFVAVLGHDLRNPIAAVTAGTNRLSREGWTERSPLILQLMKSSLLRMAGLVDNVLDLTRVRLGGGLVLDVREGSIVETVRQVVDEIRVAHPQRDIRNAFVSDRAVAVDHARFAQLLSNLVANAVTHGAEDVPIAISGRVLSNAIEVSVHNGGKPIPAAQLDKLFMPFRRGDVKPNMEGLGLGLFIASEIAKAHGGSIDVKSDPSGTSFTFQMPLNS